MHGAPCTLDDRAIRVALVAALAAADPAGRVRHELDVAA
ncbi:hypothetical protein, partial [Frankia sp. CpI1-P]